VYESPKVRENRLRRMAARQGVKLVKARRKDHRAIDYGTYWLVGTGLLDENDTRPCYLPDAGDIYEPRRVGFTLDEMEEALNRGVVKKGEMR